MRQTIVSALAVLGVSASLVGAIAPLQARPAANPTIPSTPPELTLTVQRQRGTCPQQFQIWTSMRWYEGGGEHTVIADTAPVAARATFVVNRSTVVEYRAPLKSEFASCVGRASSTDYPYRVRFEQGSVFFRVDLTQANRNPATPAEITFQALLTGRPYVQWAIAD